MQVAVTKNGFKIGDNYAAKISLVVMERSRTLPISSLGVNIRLVGVATT